MYSLGKSEHLCSRTLIGELLASGNGFVKYPFRVIWKPSSMPGEYPARMAVSVSKRKFRRAVRRNRIKRLVRETYRLNKKILYSRIPEGQTLDILFIYLDDRLPAYSRTEKSVTAALRKLADLFPEAAVDKA